ncbi:hypothetical protein A6F68_00700 [Tsuneonella dongtanensis]|uniref:Uncharacterized protein n=1 Tax=Tsuneonella dongtanensis TaxID=692370 RepID=A0A1B2AAN9_9SPHN|nr:hypothetical protein [Tsuneonella dongtanensis]ANY19229.1 hypothetical protein A6F68_00700 [Tsuneonella dongtanensis]
MQAIALVLVLLFALWIAGAGVFALARPAAARSAIGRFASSHRVNLIEQAGRGIAGAALNVRAPAAWTPDLFTVAGWAIVVTSVLLAVLPLRWHAAYAQWWSRNLPFWAVRLAGVAALALAGGLARAAIG